MSFGIKYEVNNFWANTGNTWGAQKILGNLDNFPLDIRTNNITRIYVSDPTTGRTIFSEGITTRAGAAGTNTAPIKITDGVLNTVPENGAVEWTNTNGLFITQAGIRYAIGAMGSANNLENWISGRNGLNTTVTGGNNVVFGINYNLAITTGFNNAIFGSQIAGLTTGNQNTAAGTYITMGAITQRGVFLGSGFTGVNTPGDRNIWIGTNITSSGTYRNNVVIGSTAYLTGDDMCIIGSGFEDLQLKTFYLGGSQSAQGVYNDNGQYTFTWAIPERFKIAATADMNAHNLVIKGSLGTGSGTGGNITFQTQDSGPSGTTLRSPVSRMVIYGNTGNIGFLAYPNTRNDFGETRLNQIGTDASGNMLSFDANGAPITMADLITKRDNSELIPGNYYNVTDSAFAGGYWITIRAESSSALNIIGYIGEEGKFVTYDIDTDTGMPVMQMAGTGASSRWGVFGNQSAQAVAIPDPSGGATVDTEARTAIVDILTAMRNFGFIAP